MPEATPTVAAASRRAWTFFVFMALLLAATAAYLLARARKAPPAAAPAARAATSARPNAELDAKQRARLRSLLAAPHISYRSARDGEFGKIVVAALDAPEERRLVTELACERVYFAGGAGLCLRDKRDSVEAQTLAVVVDGDYRARHQFLLPGFPSRTRVSADGSYAVSTVFVSGDSYNTGGFSTRTNLFDLKKLELLADVDEFDATRNDQRFRKVDFNYWGVTFQPNSSRFYATLATSGETLLVEGDIEKRQIRVLGNQVECPSLAPNGRRIAFKRRTKPTEGWRLYVLDLTTKREHAIEAEARSIDDQVEWLDDAHILYGLTDNQGLPAKAMNVWVAPADNAAGAKSRLFIAGASSPVVEAARMQPQ